MNRTSRLDQHLGVITVLATAGLLGLAWFLGLDGPGPRGAVWLFVLTAAIGELLHVDNPRGRPVPLSVAVIATFALLGNPPWAVVGVAVAGWTIAHGLRRLRGEFDVRIGDVVQRCALGWALAGVTGLGVASAPHLVLEAQTAPDDPVHLVAFLAVAIVIVAGVPLWHAVEETDRSGVPAGPVYVGLLVATWPSGLALAAAVGLAALIHSVLGGWALLLMLLPLLAARTGLQRYTQVRRTYDQTVRAMSRLPEVVGSAEPEHGVRVGSLAVAVARELGLPDSEVEALERAAHLHEIGQVTAGGDEHEVARASASVVREAGSMPLVAEIVEHYREPYRLRHQGANPAVSMTARVLRTVCDFDRFTHPSGPGRSPWDALERLHLAMAYDHDPVVIQALGRVLERGEMRLAVT